VLIFNPSGCASPWRLVRDLARSAAVIESINQTVSVINGYVAPHPKKSHKIQGCEMGRPNIVEPGFAPPGPREARSGREA
jgi:hypothetical protein